MLDLRATPEVFRLFADPSRVRILCLLAEEPLSVAELTRVTGLAQSRVSTHLAKLREAGLARTRKSADKAYWEAAEADGGEGGEASRLWVSLRPRLSDPLLEDDRQRVRALVAARRAETWADNVAGQMERHYSPGRTFESTARALLGCVRLGEVVDVASGDGALAELLAPVAERITCVNLSSRVVAAGRERLRHLAHVRFVEGDMHALPLPSAAFDQAFLMNALTYAEDTGRVLAGIARLLRAGGRLAGTTLMTHAHAEVLEAYGHRQLGFDPKVLRAALKRAGFFVERCEITHEEKRAPHFKVITFSAEKGKERR